MEKIEEGYEVFIADGEHPVGAVRRIHHSGDLVVYFENAGDRTIPLAAISDVHSSKVILDIAKIDAGTRDAIRHVHDAEDPEI